MFVCAAQGSRHVIYICKEERRYLEELRDQKKNSDILKLRDIEVIQSVRKI